MQRSPRPVTEHAGGAPTTRVVVRFGDGRLDLEVRSARGQAAPHAEGAGFAVHVRMPLGEAGA